MNILNDILNTLNLCGTLYFRTDFSGPWAATVPEIKQAVRFHLVVRGKCTIQFPSGKYLEIVAGDLVLVPNGSSHIISDKADRPAPLLETVLETSGYNGSGVLVIGEGNTEASTQLVCGHFNFRNNADHPLLKAFPEYILITKAMRVEQVWLDDMLKLLVHRLYANEIANTGVVTRLSESVFIEILRIGFSSDSKLDSMLKAFSDKQLSNALKLIHASPETPWTVQLLAKEIGMSRSRFADKFRQLMEIGPMTYLAEWRIQKALSLLEKSKISIQQIASKTGYQSPAAFTRAFSSKVGITPTEYRRSTV